VGLPLSYKRTAVVYNCCWPSPAQSFSGASPEGLMTKFYSLRFETPPILKVKVPVFIFPRNRVVQLYPQALGSPFVGSYNSQGYVGGIRTRPHVDCNSQPKSKSELLFDRRFTANQSVLAPTP
jgi:hypothetical protein